MPLTFVPVVTVSAFICVVFYPTQIRNAAQMPILTCLSDSVSSPLLFLWQKLAKRLREETALLLLLAPLAHYVLALKPHYENARMALHLKQILSSTKQFGVQAHPVERTHAIYLFKTCHALTRR